MSLQKNTLSLVRVQMASTGTYLRHLNTLKDACGEFDFLLYWCILIQDQNLWTLSDISPKDDNEVDDEEVAIDQHGIVHMLLPQVPLRT